MEITDKIAVIAAAIAFGSAMVSILAIYVPWRNTHDAEIFKESILALERAFRSLMLNAALLGNLDQSLGAGSRFLHSDFVTDQYRMLGIFQMLLLTFLNFCR